MLKDVGENGKNPLSFGTTLTPGLTTPLARHFRMFFPMWLLPPIDSICFLCVCLNYITEKIELPNSTSTEVEMTPTSDASEPVQNGNLSHTMEAAEAQVWLFSIGLLSHCSCCCLNVDAQAPRCPRRPKLLTGRISDRIISLCVYFSVPAKGPTCVKLLVY